MSSTWVLADPAGRAVAEVVNSPERKCIIARNGARLATVQLTHDDVETRAIMAMLPDGVPQLRCFRDGDLWISSYLAGLDEIADGKTGGSQLTATFHDPLGRMTGENGRFTQQPITDWTFTQVDQGAIAWGLIDLANTDAATGIREGAITATKVRDRTYENKNIGEALVELSQVLDGYDFELAPLDPTLEAGYLAELVVHAHQGTDRPDVLFGLGPGTVANVSGVKRQQQPPVNRVRVVNSEGLTGNAQNDASIARYGVFERVFSATDVVEQSTLDEKARDALRPDWIRVVSFTPDADSAPQPSADYWIGDTVRFYARQGALLETLEPRVNGITITLDADDHETHEITLEAAI